MLGRRDLLNGRRATCYPGFEDELHGAHIVNERVCEDGHIITARGPGCVNDFAFAIAARFVDSATLSSVKSDMLL